MKDERGMGEEKDGRIFLDNPLHFPPHFILHPFFSSCQPNAVDDVIERRLVALILIFGRDCYEVK